MQGLGLTLFGQCGQSVLLELRCQFGLQLLRFTLLGNGGQSTLFELRGQFGLKLLGFALLSQCSQAILLSLRFVLLLFGQCGQAVLLSLRFLLLLLGQLLGCRHTLSFDSFFFSLCGQLGLKLLCFALLRQGSQSVLLGLRCNLCQFLGLQISSLFFLLLTSRQRLTHFVGLLFQLSHAFGFSRFLGFFGRQTCLFNAEALGLNLIRPRLLLGIQCLGGFGNSGSLSQLGFGKRLTQFFSVRFNGSQPRLLGLLGQHGLLFTCQLLQRRLLGHHLGLEFSFRLQQGLLAL